MFPEMTEGKFKTEAQENRYVARNYCIWRVATDAIASASLSSVVRNDVYTWFVDVVGPEGGEPLYSFEFKTQAVRNAIELCGGKMPTVFKDFLSKTLVERALQSLLKDVYLPHDSAGFCNVELKNQKLHVDLLTTHRGYPIMKENNGDGARTAWLGSFMRLSRAKRYFNDLLDVIRVRQLAVEIKLRDVDNMTDSAMFMIYPKEILDYAKTSSVSETQIEGYIVGKLGGQKQERVNRGKFIEQHGPNRLRAAVAPTSKSKRVYEVVEEMPSFPGGKPAIIAYIAKAVKYPGPCLDNKVEGRVICRFTITRDGAVKDVTVTKSVDPLLDKEAVRVISLMPKWIPAKHNGERVDAKYSLPVTFRITENFENN
jgi:TonB family protein